VTELVEGKHASLAQVWQDDAERVTGRLVEVEVEECQRDDSLRVQFQITRERVADVALDEQGAPDVTQVLTILVGVEHVGADFGLLINVWGSPIRVLVPMVVVDELDGLKQSKDRHVRWRAGYTLAVLDRLFAKTTGPARLHAAGAFPPAPDGRMRGEAMMELVFDPPAHVRLPINDDEIVDRALAIEPLADRKVTLLTYDTGQSTRARNAGLQVVKLSKDIGEEPE